MSYLFTSESVCAGHPDKICDQISDAIVDACLEKDPKSRAAVEAMVTKDRLVLAGEVTSRAKVNYREIARGVIGQLGYARPEWGFSKQAKIEVYIHEQASDIAQGVDDGGAGDQGMMFGYACDQTDSLMPLPIVLAHELARAMDELQEKYDWVRPDGKTQVTVNFDSGKPTGVEQVILAKPHDQSISVNEFLTILRDEVVKPVLNNNKMKFKTDTIVLNGTGTWELGGPASDTGVTGRKIVVDTYGGWARVGGGAFSGKDPTKVDRSGAYAARYVAKNLVANQLCRSCEVGIAYVIGKAEPVWVQIDTQGTGTKPERLIREAARRILDFRVQTILDTLELRKPQYQQVAAYGHFGIEGVTWENIVEI
jgi:S-adenosylmethionine synthetase